MCLLQFGYVTHNATTIRDDVRAKTVMDLESPALIYPENSFPLLYKMCLHMAKLRDAT